MTEVDGELICPKTDLPCNYFHLCAARKETIEEGGPDPDSIAGKDLAVVDTLAPKVAAIMRKEFCSEARALGLYEVSVNPAATLQDQRTGEEYAERELHARSFFPTTSNS